MPNLEIVSLSVNKIRTLKPFSFLPKLRELYLRKNMIADLNEIKYLIDNNNLKILWLSENPICENPNYRNIIISVLPQIIKLDDIIISEEERINANKGISIQMSHIKDSNNNHIDNDDYDNYENNNIKNKQFKNKNYNISDEDDNNNFIYEYYNNKKDYIRKNTQRNKDINIYDNDNFSNNNEFNDYNQYNERKKNNKKDYYEKDIRRDDNEDMKYDKNKRRIKKNYDYDDDNYYERNNYREDETIYYRRKYNNKTVLNCVMMLIDELNFNELDIVKKKIERIQNNKYH